MDPNEILTNTFHVEYDPKSKQLCVYTINRGVKTDQPIRMPLDSLTAMGSQRAAEWVGQSLLLLIPDSRREIFGLDA